MGEVIGWAGTALVVALCAAGAVAVLCAAVALCVATSRYARNRTFR